MAGSVIEGWKIRVDEGRGGRNVRGPQSKNATRSLEMQRVGTEVYWGVGHCFSVYNNVLYGIFTWLHLLLQCILGHWKIITK